MADNLLDKASILLTPTAYDNGRILSIKPNENLYGSELVTNGDFATDSNWTKGTGWSISNGKSSCDGVSFGNYLSQTSASTLILGKTYKVSFDLEYTSGTLFCLIGSSNPSTNTSGNITTGGSKEFYITISTLSDQLIYFRSNYFVGSIDNVSVVEDLSGDFNFERNSAATRVNAQGLVENVQIISSELVSNGNFSQIGTEEVLNGNFSQEGSELVTNGDFSNGLNNWSVNGGSYATIVDGALNSNNTENGSWFAENISQNISFVNGKTYKVTFKAKNISGALNLRITHQSHIVFSDNLTSNFVDYTVYYTSQAPNDSIRIFCNDDVGEFQIDNVSVKEVGQNWSLGTGWSIGDGKAVCDGSQTGNTSLQQSGVAISGKIYKIQFDLIVDAGFINYVNLGGWIDNTNLTTTGTYTYYTTTTTNTDNLGIAGDSNFDGSISNISVKEVGQDWTLGNGWSIDQANSKADATDAAFNSQLANSAAIVASKKYKISFDVSNYVKGNVIVKIGNTSSATVSSNGSFTFTLTSANTSSFQIATWAGSGTTLSISNISVKEITDDTNIPRINYEGFSYQDSLGSELITNGNFSNGLTNWTNNSSWWSIVNGEAYHPASTSMKPLSQSVSTEVGKEYKISVNVNIVSGTPQVFWDKVSGQEAQSLSQGLNEVIVTTFKTNSAIYFGRVPSTNTEFYIDNVSVKEYLGQEVVPDSGCGSWLLEPQSTNLLPYSEDFSFWAAGTGGLSIETGYLAPDGSSNATKVTMDSGFSNTALTFYASLGTTESRTIYARTVSGTGKAHLCSFNGNASSLFDVTEQWQRFEVNGDNSAGAPNFYAIDFRGSTDLSEIIVWGAQAENLSYATSYIPTNGATNTRLQYISTNSGNSSLINSTEGVLYAQISALVNSGTDRAISLFEDANNTVSLFYFSATNTIRALILTNASTQAQIDFILSDATDFNKIALKYKENDCALWVNGIEVGTDVNATIPTALNSLDFKYANSNFYGKAKALAVYKEALTDANLRSLTYPNPVATTFDLDFDTIAEQFTFTRGSEATFVNAQGLIESTNQLGPELVTNGDFSVDSNWTKQVGWSISGGKANSDGSGNYQSISQSSLVSPVGKTYKVTYEVSDYVSGEARCILGGFTFGQITSSNGVVTEYLTASNASSNTFVYIETRGSGFIGSIDNVSVKEVISATNTPRIDYSTGTEAFLLEPQSTNLITYSEDFSQWQNGGGTQTIVQNAAISPEGVSNASSIQIDSGYVYKQVSGLTVSIGDKYTWSCYISSSSQKITFGGGTVSGTDVYSSEDVGNGWYKQKITRTFSANGTIIQPMFNESQSGTDLFYIWGAQLEQQSYATSYIPTSGASATRNQELCVDATPVINSEEGTLYFEASSKSDSLSKSITLFGQNANDRVEIKYRPNNTSIQVNIFSSGSLVFNVVESLAVESINKIAVKYKQNDFALWINGIKVATDTSGNTPTGLVSLNFDVASGNFFFGNTKGLKYYPKALADVQLEDLTTI